jgi:signal transduction histidine kinase
MPHRDPAKDLKWKAVSIVVAILAISSLHYATEPSQALLHDVYRRLYYIPVALGAVWFGLRGGVAVSFAVALIYIPHIAMVWNDMGRELANRSMEVILFFAFATIIGYFADRERRFRLGWKQSAMKLERSYEKLKHQADSLVETEEQLRRADRLAVIGQLTAGLTHEIRNPLGSIKGAAEILRDEFPTGHPKAEFLDILIKETAQLNQVVEDFLGFARDRQDHGAVERADLGAIVREAISLLERQTRKQHLTITCDIPEAAVVEGSPVHVKQVILNLILNAVQASGDNGHVVVRGEIQSSKIVGAERREVEGALAVLFVEDEGPGIPQKELDKVFTPFFTTKEEGTGLGLAISQRIVMSLGGTLEAGNRETGGARFTLSLPLAT